MESPPVEDPASDYDQLYASGGFGYDERREYWLEWARVHYVQAFDLTPGLLLDVGSGDGFWTSIFAELGFEATGVDISPGGIEAARSKYPGSSFLVADADQPLPFEAGSFDVIFCRAISHLSAQDLETPRAISLIGRLTALLAPGGILLASYNSTRDGRIVNGRTHHPVSTLVRLLEHGGIPYRVEVVGNYVQIGVSRAGAPTRRSSAQPGRGPGRLLRLPLRATRRLAGVLSRNRR